MATEDTILETVRRERAEALSREAAESNGARMETGYSEGRCTPFRVIEEGKPVTHGILCGSRAPRRKCQVCKKKWSIAQCDYPVGGDCKKCKGKGQTHIGALEVTEETVKDGIRAYLCHDCAGTGRAMCNKRVCADCRSHREPDEDYCPDHREAAGFKMKRELCGWQTEVMVVSRACLHRECPTLIEFGARVLFFPKRNRAMCESCGEEYLKVTE